MSVINIIKDWNVWSVGFQSEQSNSFLLKGHLYIVCCNVNIFPLKKYKNCRFLDFILHILEDVHVQMYLFYLKLAQL